jgi:hypothetical protein
MRTNQCRRCSECKGQDHHWLDNPDFGNGDDPDDPASVDYQFTCKHCPAMGGECPDCDGLGIQDDDIEDDRDCPRCQGVGIVDGLACTTWRD